MKKIALILMSIVVFMHSGKVFAWHDEFTHPRLTDAAIQASQIQIYLKGYLGLHQGIGTSIGDKTLADLFKGGSQVEDVPLCRASNHFHTPHRNRTESCRRMKI